MLYLNANGYSTPEDPEPHPPLENPPYTNSVSVRDYLNLERLPKQNPTEKIEEIETGDEIPGAD